MYSLSVAVKSSVSDLGALILVSGTSEALGLGMFLASGVDLAAALDLLCLRDVPPPSRRTSSTGGAGGGSGKFRFQLKTSHFFQHFFIFVSNYINFTQ